MVVVKPVHPPIHSPAGGVFFCSLSTLTYVARIMFAYSRDKAVPLHSLWCRVRAGCLLPSSSALPALAHSRAGVRACLPLAARPRQRLLVLRREGSAFPNSLR